MTAYDLLIACCRENKGNILRASRINSWVRARGDTGCRGVSPQDYCYNYWNRGIACMHPLFEKVDYGKYKCLGPDHAYTGPIIWCPKGKDCVKVVGEWVNGRRTLYAASTSTQPRRC